MDFQSTETYSRDTFIMKYPSEPEYHFGVKCTSGPGVEKQFFEGLDLGYEDHHQGQLVAQVRYQKQRRGAVY
jgi:hypothetical protein